MTLKKHQTDNYINLANRLREDLHKIPELGNYEFKTSEYIRDFLVKHQIKYDTIIETGTVVFFDFGFSEAIAVRADIDALPIQEETGLKYASLHKNTMHACGHDGHTTQLLMLAHFLNTAQDQHNFKTNILLIFQPAEEGPGGAQRIVQSGIFQKHNVKSIIGMHLFPGLNYGEIGCKEGPFMAQNGELHVEITGKSAHGAQPQTGVDTIIVASSIIQKYQEIISRKINPLEPAVITIGTIHGGDANNIICEKLTLSGTVRTFSEETFKIISDEILKIHKSAELEYSCEIISSLPPMYPPVINDATLVRNLKNISMQYTTLQPFMLAEDFAYYQKEIPGVFFFLGTNDSVRTHPLHSSKFDFNPDVLVIGLNTIIDYLLY